MTPLDVTLTQGVDNQFIIPFTNPATSLYGPTTIPDPTAIASCHLTVEAPNYGAAVLPTLTKGSGVTFALDAGGTACDATVKYTAAQMASILGAINQPQSGCVGNLNMTATITGGGTISSTIPIRVTILPNATSGA